MVVLLIWVAWGIKMIGNISPCRLDGKNPLNQQENPLSGYRSGGFHSNYLLTHKSFNYEKHLGNQTVE
jgi:hypothetical protein